jgi:hypothetical protein
MLSKIAVRNVRKLTQVQRARDYGARQMSNALVSTSEIHMLKKTAIALAAALGLFATIDTGAKAQGGCGEWSSAYARPRC